MGIAFNTINFVLLLGALSKQGQTPKVEADPAKAFISAVLKQTPQVQGSSNLKDLGKTIKSVITYYSSPALLLVPS